jgi:N-acetylglucosaminyl-diphospho-decaprenol L-rhamnosyltransferase
VSASGATVIVPTVLGGARLVRLLDSLHTGGDAPAVLVVDNASGDPGLADLPRRYSKLDVIPAGSNLGFGRAVHLAARRSDTDALVLVNDDCVCEPGFLDALISALGSGPDVAMVAGVLLDARRPELIDSAGVVADHTLMALDYLSGEPRAAAATAPPPLGPTGGAAAYDRRAFEAAGGFDERLFAYLEDLDLALRLRLAGHRCALASDAVAVHQHAGTLGAGSARKNRLMGFGRGYLLRKWAVVTPRRLPGVLMRETIICGGQALHDRNLAGISGRLAGWRAATPGAYPREALPPELPSGLEVLRRRIARRGRVRGTNNGH